EVYNSELDDRDANLVNMPNGTIVLTWITSDVFTWKEYSRPEWSPRIDRITQKMRDELLGHWLIRSFDGGHTWEHFPHRIQSGGAEHAGPSVLSDGSLICIGYKPVEGGYKKAAFISKDEGVSWGEIGEIPCEYEKFEHAGRALRWYYGERPYGYEKNEQALFIPIISEYNILEVSPGNLIALFRMELRKDWGYIYQSVSQDNGKTWSIAKKLPIWGFPPHMIRLSSGAILCVYSHRCEPWSVRAILSYDGGITWDTSNIITIDEWEDKPDMGYPVSVEVEPNQILTVYYCSRQDSIHLRHEEKIKGLTSEGLLWARYTLE
ncbi:MAG: exo-alpha-sialidase, partial [Candidatus Omnitrophica bacterium]|nr:exo-alpha-sialidase [Candidatus Omnitrophota bacterium]